MRITTNELRPMIGQRLKALRLDSRYSVAEVASALDISTDTLTRIERGGMIPNLIRLHNIAVFFDAPIEFFITGSGLNRALALPDDDFVWLKGLFDPKISIVRPKITPGEARKQELVKLGTLLPEIKKKPTRPLPIKVGKGRKRKAPAKKPTKGISYTATGKVKKARMMRGIDPLSNF